ncbi:DoxX family protein [Amphritea pacifica]|uniref:DoxX family protein n=1 Tax=Amphritea pacifica TaxID=2811233 RepID=A0ABS2W8M9_9GAMM|nr:DoxX family protein [Amphritea pacifica]MBN0988029.1 DoxX family protein [Amphritea pacifica]MBN1005677.1 DoxX family protein [Amphritea pacifica]
MNFSAVLSLLARFGLAAVFIIAGWGKIGGYEGTVGYMESMGVPGILLPVVIALELLGGIAIVVGFMTRWVAAALALFSIATALIFHSNFAEQVQFIMFMKNFAIAGGFLLLVANGAGCYSLDAWSKRAK